MFRKKEVYTQITPIPRHIPRQLAIDMLQSHSEVITLNPLVLEHHPISAPRSAAAEEYYSTWYEITERVQYVPGVGKLGSGVIRFKGCFHDMPWGLQTHIYAPLNTDLRNKWRIAGNQPGEPAESRELGVGAPSDGLYLREDIEIKANVAMVSFVKSQMRTAAKVMVDRFVKKAELLDNGVLQAMMENGRLKTFNPADRTQTTTFPPQSPLPSGMQSHLPPGMQSPRTPYRIPSLSCKSDAGSNQGDYDHHQSSYGPPPNYHHQSNAVELPGDYQPLGSPLPQSLQPQHLQPPQIYEKRDSTMSSGYPSPGLDSRWSHYSSSTRPTSYASDVSRMNSPPLNQKGFVAELPSMEEKMSQPEPRYPYGPNDVLHN